MRKGIKILKIIIEVVLWLLFLLIPVGLTVCLLRDEYSPWWVSMLAGAGVVLIEALVVNFVEAFVAISKEHIRENSRKRKESTNK